MIKQLNIEQTSFILEEFQGKLYNFYNNEIMIHTLSDSNYFDSLESKVTNIISVLNDTESNKIEVNALKSLLISICDEIYSKYSLKTIYFTDEEWDRLIKSIEMEVYLWV